ncbi:HEAT repeat domain-containing protein [Microcoleus sp. FACHB-672]|uniref:HEAT repeat domain-containing protein n=1 Tax=Microcoleus sp. FACHB-672 TaxID=2692825 RepID=UPI0016865728|nr:HEAT repeat domain-containing protein [Microcoleus sp. FACHB-672]MBD2043644.1 HEAT repeat domain-containing protein [Microcoleus sp. FACHB-672]
MNQPRKPHGVPTKPDAINWREICCKMLQLQRQLASNLLISGIDIPIEDELGNIEGDFFNKILAKGQSRNSKGKRLKIIGEPGSGKTTQLLKIADWLLDDSPNDTATEFVKPLPIWISLAQVKKPLHQYLREDWLRKAAEKLDSVPPAWVEEFTQLLKDGKVCLLLNGADEMGIADPLGTLAQWLRTPLFKNVPVVISCRLNIWGAAGNVLSDFDSYKVLGFSYAEDSHRDQVKQFIEKWFNKSSSMLSGAEKIEASQLRAALDEPGKERIKDLARNPLHLSLLCFTWQSRKRKLPDTKAELYQIFFEAFYESKNSIYPTTPAQQKNLNAALGQLALKAIDQGCKSILPYSLVNKALEKLHPELFEQALTLGWLNRVVSDAQNPLKSAYAFYHPTFLEYFAACEIKDWQFFLNPLSHSIERDNYRIFEPQWKEVFLLWLGRVDVPEEQKEESITSLVKFKDGCGEWHTIDANKGFYELRAYLIAAAGVTEFCQCSKSEEIVRQIVKWGVGYFNIEKQQWQTFLDHPIAEAALPSLPQTQRSKAINTLVELIGNTEDEDTRRMAAESLGNIGTGNETAIRALVELIGNSRNESTRRRAVYSLGKIGTGNETAIRALVELIGNCGDESTRREAVYSLEKSGTGNETTIRALAELIGSCGDESTRRMVAESLEKIGTGNETAIRAIAELIGNTEDKDTRRKAAESLGNIGVGNETAINALVGLIGNCGDESTHWRAAESLEKIGTGNETAINALVELIGNTEDEHTRKKAAESLGKIGTGNETAINALVELIGNCKYEFICREAAESLGDIGTGSETAINALVELIGNSKDKDTRSRAAESLGKIDPGNETAIRTLVKLTGNSKDKDTRRKAAESLGKIDPGNETAINALVELIGNTELESTRREAAESLGDIGTGSETAIRALVKLIGNSQSESTRRKAAESLGKIGTGNETAICAIAELISRCGDESNRRMAAESLEKISTDNETTIRAIAELIGNTEDKDTHWWAAERLGNIGVGNETAINALVGLIGNCGHESTRWWAGFKLQRIVATEKQMAAVVSALKDCLSHETYENDFNRFYSCYEVIWNCAQTLPYPDFYRAWHRLPSTHPEMQDISAAENTLDTQRLNLETLPQILITATNSNPDLCGKIKLICIDGSKFIDPDNPAPEIYDFMLDLDCPERPNGEPETMQALKLYWNAIRRKSDQLPVWIFYEDSSAPEPQEFSEIFLKALSKFDGAICVVTDTPQPACLQGKTLRWFDATEPDLTSKILVWIRAILLES